MSVDPSRFNSSAVTIQTTSDQGTVAPPRFDELVSATPEAQPSQQERQPAQQDGQVASGGQQQSQQATAPPSQPNQEYEARVRAAEQARSQAEAEAQSNRQILQQIQSYAVQNQAQQQRQNQINMVLAQAEAMPSEDANRFLRDQMTNLVGQTELSLQQQFAHREQDYQQQIRHVAAPQYADHLIEATGLPPEAKQELIALGDPDLMYRYAPVIKQRYDELATLRGGQTQQTQQLARSQEVLAMANAGLANIGGQSAGGSITFEASDDPDERAMQIRAIQIAREQGRL